MKPTKGMRFYHARVLDSMRFDGKTPQLYQVTKVGLGSVYYRPVYNYGDRESLGAVECCSVNWFDAVVKELA